jgi:hypothetical protein
MRIHTLFALTLLAGCPGSDPEPCSGDDCECEDADCIPACTQSINAVTPDGDSPIFYQTAFGVTLGEADESATLTLTDAAGAEVASTVSNDGTSLQLVPDAALDPSSDYTLTIGTCLGDTTVDMTTSAAGTPVAAPADLLGATWDLDLASGTFLEPAGVGSLLGSLIGDVRVFLGVTAYDEATEELSLIGAIGDPSGQDLCTETLDLPQPAAFSNPEMTLQSDSLPITVADLTVDITDLDIAGTVLPDGSGIAGARLAGSLDTRDLGDLLPGEEGQSPCELLSGFGAECIACSDGEVACIALDVVDLVASEHDAEIVPRTTEDIDGDASCDDGE